MEAGVTRNYFLCGKSSQNRPLLVLLFLDSIPWGISCVYIRHYRMLVIMI